MANRPPIWRPRPRPTSNLVPPNALYCTPPHPVQGHSGGVPPVRSTSAPSFQLFGNSRAPQSSSTLPHRPPLGNSPTLDRVERRHHFPISLESSAPWWSHAPRDAPSLGSTWAARSVWDIPRSGVQRPAPFPVFLGSPAPSRRPLRANPPRAFEPLLPRPVRFHSSARATRPDVAVASQGTFPGQTTPQVNAPPDHWLLQGQVDQDTTRRGGTAPPCVPVLGDSRKGRICGSEGEARHIRAKAEKVLKKKIGSAVLNNIVLQAQAQLFAPLGSPL